MSENRDPAVFIEDMLKATEKIIAYAKGITPEELFGHQETVDAILYNLLILGKAAKGVPEEIRATNPEIPWRSITGMRDKIIHQYWGVNQILVWKAVTEEIPPLISLLKGILDTLDTG